MLRPNPLRAARGGLSLALAGLIGLVAAGICGPAEARPQQRPAAKGAAPDKAAKPLGPVFIVVSIGQQRVKVYGGDGLIAQSGVSTGRTGFPTPTGVFTVIQKSRWHRSNIYSGAPMPFMQRITWSGVALHAGVLPGYPASHGCIRMTHAFAAELWGMTRMGARVVVTPDDVPAVELAHQSLPVPLLTPEPAGGESGRQAGLGETESGPPMLRSASLIGIAQAETAPDAGATQPAPVKLLNPLERAKAAKVQATADAALKAKTAKAAVEASAIRAAEANKGIVALRDAELAVSAARTRREAAAKAVEAARTPEAGERAKVALEAAELKVKEAETVAQAAREVESVKTAEAFAAAREAWDAEAASTAAAAALKAAERGTDPVTVFVSRKAGRVYIRQAWAPIYEAPVTFKDPDAPLGTHVYLATEPIDEGKALRWLALSMPQARAEPPRPEARRRGRAEPPPPVAAVARRETAASVLERIEMSEETKAFIADKMWIGASLIVSDQGISNETGKYTDFIVLTR